MEELSSPSSSSVSVRLATFIVTCICATLGMMTSICFLVFHIYHRQNKLVKMSSPYMNMITSLGTLVLCVVCFLYGIDFLLQDTSAIHSTLCQARHWLAVHSITLIFGPVTVKAWRVHNIFKYGFAKKVVIKDIRLLAILAGLALVDGTLMTLWQIIDPVTIRHQLVSEVLVDGQSEGSNLTLQASRLYHECDCDTYTIWLVLHFLWKTLLILACLYFNWKTRYVSLPGLNDSPLAFAAILSSVLVTCCTVKVTSSLHGERDVIYIVSAVAIATCAIFIQVILFLPKVQYWWKTPNNTSQRISSGSLIYTDKAIAGVPSSPVVDDFNANVYQNSYLVQIAEMNRALNYTIDEKDVLIQSLQEKVKRYQEIQNTSNKPSTDSTSAADAMEASVDAASETSDVKYDEMRTPAHKRCRAGMYNTSSGNQSKMEHNNVHQSLDLQFTDSNIVQTEITGFVEEFTEIDHPGVSDVGETIANEMCSEPCTVITPKCPNMNNNSRNNSISWTHDKPADVVDWLYETHNASDIAGSIMQSYNLTDDTELMSYINSCISPVPDDHIMQLMSRSSGRLSSASVMSFSEQSSEVVSASSNNKTVNESGIGNALASQTATMTSLPRDSATPTSQQHAAILRCCAYRHAGFKRFKHFRPHSFKIRSIVSTDNCAKDLQILHDRRLASPSGAVYSVSKGVRNVVQNQPDAFNNDEWSLDSFV